MGLIEGWDELRDGVILQGHVKGKAELHSDGDWTFQVDPDPRSKYLLENPNGYINDPPLVECEVEPPDRLYSPDPYDVAGEDAETQAAVDHHLDVENQWVVVTGTWVRDRAHSWDHEKDILPWPAGDGNEGKTEVHPVTSLLIERKPAVNNRTRVVDFLVFCDDSANLAVPRVQPYPTDPAVVPHSGEDREGRIDIPIRRGATIKTDVIVDMARSKSWELKENDRFTSLKASIWSGTPTPDDLPGMHGFYHVKITLPGFTLLTYLLSRGLDPRFGVRELMEWAGVKSLRALFDRLDTGSFVPKICRDYHEQIKSLEQALNQASADIAQAAKENLRDPEAEKEHDEIEHELTDVRNRARAAGCIP